MARLHGDGFDHYGNDVSNMLDGEYAQASGYDGGGGLTSAIVATGTHSFYMNGKSGLSDFSGLRKVLPAAKDKLGCMGRFYIPNLGTHLYANCIFSLLSAAPNRGQLQFIVDANGTIRVVRGATTYGNGGAGTDGALIAQTDPIIVASAQNHIECQAYIHDTQGWVRIAVNGVHKFEATGLDTKFDASNVVSVAQHGTYLDNANFFIDDYVIYDFAGNPAVDTDWCPTYDGAGKATSYIGDLQGMLLLPNADTAEADWLRSAGGAPSYPFIGKAVPNDATYLYSAAAGDLSEFGLSDLPPEITYVRGLDIIGRLSKSDGGAAMTKFGMKSVAAVTDAAERPVTVEPTYWRDQVNVDPNSAARWTRASLNAGWVRLTRSV